MRPALREEIREFLLEHGPARAKEVAFAIRARRDDVDAVLAGAGFLVTERPAGANSRARYFDVSHRVPGGRGGKSRADAMLAVLRDGRIHSRDEIFQLAGRFFLTNNAASELRSRGFDVCHGRQGRLDVYWLKQPAVRSKPSGSKQPRTVRALEVAA